MPAEDPAQPIEILSTPIEIAAARVATLLERRKATRDAREALFATSPTPDGGITGKVDRIAAAIEHHIFQPANTATHGIPTRGWLLAVGDSWFNYPFPFDDDILVQLHDLHGYNVESAARFGSRVESMPYDGGQIDKFRRNADKLNDQGLVPKAILISAGGNDIAGEEFGMLLNSQASAISGWNASMLEGLIQQRLLVSYQVLIHQLNMVSMAIYQRTFPILIHGYDYPIPDGRGFLGGIFGPWLWPGFREKLFTDVKWNAQQMIVVIDQFNAMLARVAADPTLGDLHYVDLRRTLSGDLNGDTYRADWDNELHPTERGFQAVAAKFAAVLDLL